MRKARRPVGHANVDENSFHTPIHVATSPPERKHTNIVMQNIISTFSFECDFKQPCIRFWTKYMPNVLTGTFYFLFRLLFDDGEMGRLCLVFVDYFRPSISRTITEVI